MSVDFDPTSQAFAADPYAVYAQLRQMDAPFHWPELDMVLLSRAADIEQITIHPKMVRSLRGHRSEAELEAEKRRSGFADMPFHERFVQTNLLDSNGAEHARLRRTVFGAFMTRAIAAMERDIQAYVDDILDHLPREQSFDFVENCAAKLPGLSIGRFLGVPDSDAPKLRLWSEQVVDYFDIDKTAEKKAAAEAAVREFHDYLIALKADRIRRPKDDLISQMIAQEADGAFKTDELISTCMLILMAGHGSTIDVIGTGLLTLLQHPEAMEDLHANPDLLPTAIEEMFRYEPPLPFFHRHALEDIQIRGHHYPAGTTFGLLYASANRDEAAFPDADSFDIHRQPNRHFSFGRGTHLCLGNQLARLNMKVLFGELLKRFETIRVMEEPGFKTGLSARGLETLFIRLQ